MRIKRCACLFLSFLVVFGIYSVAANAIMIEEKNATEEYTTEYIELRATGHFDFDIPAKTLMRASSAFPMEYGETVTIKATYSPASARVDFGLIDSESIFRYESASDGIFDQTIRIDERGNYVFAIRNNASYAIHVSGFVNY